MNKRYYFRNNQIDFEKWCRLIPKAKQLVKEFTHYPKDMRDSYRIEYEESILIVRQYEVLSLSLSAEQNKYLNMYLIHTTIAPWKLYDYNRDVIFHHWQEIMFPNGIGRLKQLDLIEFGKKLKEARINAGYNMEEVAGLIGVSVATLRAYENGKAAIRVDFLYKVIIILDINIDNLIKVEKK